MCFGLIAGLAASAGGSFLDQQESDKAALREIQARNEMLSRHNQRQDAFSAEGRGNLDDYLAVLAPKDGDPLGAAQAARVNELDSQITTQMPGSEMPTSSDAPKVVEAEFAKRMGDALTANRAKADRAGRLGGFGDQMFSNAMGGQELGRKIDLTNNFSRAEANLLPQYQDFRAMETYKPPSPAGSILKGIGSAMAMGSGSGGFGKGMFAKAAADPWAGMRAVTPTTPFSIIG